MSHRTLQLTVRDILRHAKAFEWSVQGFGLLRLYLGNEGRLHVWAPCLQYDNVSMVHDHSWDLKSTIVTGVLRNRRYAERGAQSPTHWKRKLITGYNTAFTEEARLVRLEQITDEMYLPGATYSQRADEIHETVAEPYTITLMERDADKDGLATVYWPNWTEWGTAKPRPARPEEVERVAQRALKLLETL